MNTALVVMSVLALSITAGDPAQKKRAAKPVPKPRAAPAVVRTAPGVTIVEVSVVVDSTAKERGKNVPARVLVWVKNTDTLGHTGSLVVAVGSPRSETLDSTMVAVSLARLSARAIPVSLPVSASDPSETLGGFVKLMVNPDSTTYGKIETSTIKVPRPRRSAWVCWLVLGDLIIALAATIAAARPLSDAIATSEAVTWSFTKSWTTNLATIGTVVAPLVPALLPALTGHFMSRTEYLALAALLGTMFALAPAAFGLLVNSSTNSASRKKPLMVAAAVCLASLNMAAFGQLGLIVLLAFEAASAGILTMPAAVLMALLGVFVAGCVFYAESRQPERTETHMRALTETTYEETKKFVLP